MFCTSLRRRSFDSASLLSTIASPSTLALRENDLTTHDLALYIGPRNGPNTRQLRALLLSPSTVSESKLEATIDRIQRLAHLTGTQDIAIVFVISPPVCVHSVSSKSTEDHGTHGMLAYCKLQAELISRPELSIPVLPLPTFDHLPTLLQSHLAAISGSPRVQNPVTTPFQLLQHCTVTPPMLQQTAFLLTDSFDSIGRLAEGCCQVLNSASQSNSSPSFDGYIAGSHGGEDTTEKLKRLRDIVDAKEWENMVVFWQKEWALE